ncbi:MAG: DUF4833 domain-containing protein [Polyangiaceae bacterium]
MKKATLAFVVLSVVSLATDAALAGDPEPQKPLFVLERNRNKNFVRYDAKVTSDGAIDAKEPVVAYWIMAEEDGRKEPLSAIERALAYGFTAQQDKKGNVWLTLTAHKSKSIRVFKDDAGVHAETGIAGKRAYLSKMFVMAGPEFIPKVTYLDLFGVDAKTGAPLQERLTP